jgi:hypothetical protein
MSHISEYYGSYSNAVIHLPCEIYDACFGLIKENYVKHESRQGDISAKLLTESLDSWEAKLKIETALCTGKSVQERNRRRQ